MRSGLKQSISKEIANENPNFLKKTAVRIPLGAPNETHLEPHQIGVEQFLEMLRFEQRSKLEELPVTLR